MLNADAAWYLKQLYKKNYQITNAYFKSIVVGGVYCAPGSGTTASVTNLISVQLPATQGILLTEMFVRAFENDGSEFLSFALKQNNNAIVDYDVISGAIINDTAPFPVAASFDLGTQMQIQCLNYSGTSSLVVDNKTIPPTAITILGYVQGYRFQVLPSSGYMGLGA